MRPCPCGVWCVVCDRCVVCGVCGVWCVVLLALTVPLTGSPISAGPVERVWLPSSVSSAGCPAFGLCSVSLAPRRRTVSPSDGSWPCDRGGRVCACACSLVRLFASLLAFACVFTPAFFGCVVACCCVLVFSPRHSPSVSSLVRSLASLLCGLFSVVSCSRLSSVCWLAALSPDPNEP